MISWRARWGPTHRPGSRRFDAYFGFIFCIVLLLMPAAVFAADVTLAWDQPADTRVAGYKVYCGIKGSNFLTAPIGTVEPADPPCCRIFNLVEGRTYGFATTSIDKEGKESPLSEILYYKVPAGKAKKKSKADSEENIDIKKCRKIYMPEREP